MIISLVVAAANNNAIGKEGKMPWHLPNDLKHFKNITWGMPVVMGRKTFDSLGKPLPGRKNIVITRQKEWAAEGAIKAENIKDALFIAQQADANEIMIIGGGEIFKSIFNRAKKIYMTRVEADPEADTFFPVIDPARWHLMSQQNYEADEKNAYNYSFQTWERY
ncbi:MAG: dihydrofolate reductase [Bacteroidetes bacterium]|nr:dihydrofolate reductase [Bacteroidota bacterium]